MTAMDPEPDRWAGRDGRLLHEVHCREDRCVYGCDCPHHSGTCMTEFRSGDVAIDWDERTVLIRSYSPDYWSDAAHQVVGRVLHRDEAVRQSGAHIYRAVSGRGGWPVRIWPE